MDTADKIKDNLPPMLNSLQMTKNEWEVFLPVYEHILELVYEIPCNEAQEQLYRRICAFAWHAGKMYQTIQNALDKEFKK